MQRATMSPTVDQNSHGPPVGNAVDHPDDERNDRDARAPLYPMRFPRSAASLAITRHAVPTLGRSTTTTQPCWAKVSSIRGQGGLRESRKRCEPRCRLASWVSLAHTCTDSAREFHQLVGSFRRERAHAPRRRSQQARGTGKAARGRRTAIASITGFPKPSHVEGNATRSHDRGARQWHGSRDPIVSGDGERVRSDVRGLST